MAGGNVRCGRCSSVFNALARLSDEQQAAVAEGEPAAAATPEPETPAQEGPADLSPLEEALSRPEEAGTPESPSTADEPVSEDALEFDPETTDVGAVFVQPPPNPQWTAAAGSFKAMRAASQDPTPKESTTEPGDGQLDVEIDAEFLAGMLGEREPPGPSPPEPAPPEPPRAAPPPQQRAPQPRAAPPSAQPPSRAKPESTPGHGDAAAGAATRRTALPGADPRAAARHAAPHTRPPLEANARPRPAAARGPEPPPHDGSAPPATEEATSAALGL